jgi:hypothetical protein
LSDEIHLKSSGTSISLKPIQYPLGGLESTMIKKNTVKPVLKGHIWDKEKWPYKTGDLLKEVQFI